MIASAGSCGQRDAGVRVLLGEHLLHPVLVGVLKFLVEEQEAPVARAARIEARPSTASLAPARPSRGSM